MSATREPVECPHCGEATLPNRLSDGTVVCSCAAGRALPERGDG
jgi:ribosomal protein L32